MEVLIGEKAGVSNHFPSTLLSMLQPNKYFFRKKPNYYIGRGLTVITYVVYCIPARSLAAVAAPTATFTQCVCVCVFVCVHVRVLVQVCVLYTVLCSKSSLPRSNKCQQCSEEECVNTIP